MKDLVVGEFYAYRDSKWSSPQRVRVDKIGVHRVTLSAGGWYHNKSYSADGVLVAAIRADGKPGTIPGVQCAKKPDPNRRQSTDQIYDECEYVYRVLPRFLISTWDEHAAQLEANEAAKARREESNAALILELESAIGRLPIDLQPFFKVLFDRGTVRIVTDHSDADELVETILSLFDNSEVSK